MKRSANSRGGCGGWSWKGVKQMAPFVLLCLNSPNCYALFAVPSTGLIMMMIILMIRMMIRMITMMSMMIIIRAAVS